MLKQVPIYELNTRMELFRKQMDIDNPNWQMAVITSKVNQFYFTGTMQDGIIIIKRQDNAVYWVRRSFERALNESLFPDIRFMQSYRDVVSQLGKFPETIYMEKNVVPLAMYERFIKHFQFKEAQSLDKQISKVRSVKSPYEIQLMEQSGDIHRRILEERIPKLFKDGMSEVDLTSALFNIMMEEGHHGVTRFGMFDTEVILGNICFGENSIYPAYFDGPGGNLGMCPAVPVLGNRERKLKIGDLVFIDIGCGVDGYHTDKTMIYFFGKMPSQEVLDAHNKCVDIQNQVAQMLKPGETPSNIYKSVMSKLEPDFLDNFMGFGSRKVKFLGHGIGLTIDEYPVIAEGFDDPLKEGMAFAIEPKKGIDKIGMVGTENTYFVTPEGGRCITGDQLNLLVVDPSK